MTHWPPWRPWLCRQGLFPPHRTIPYDVCGILDRPRRLRL